MNKIFLTFLVPFFLLLNLVRGVYGTEKKDIADPIMQEIITELSSKMPRFINKYGTAVFVADEQITRGSLLQALYEYDKKLSSKNVTGASSISSSGVISKKDYDFLNTKILALEKKLKNIGIKGDTAKITTKTKSASFTDMMGDLEVNMPMLLDITLENSKVFKALEQKVNSSGYMDMKANIDTKKSTYISQKTLETIQRNIINLNKKVDAVESSLAFVQKEEKVSELEKEANYSNKKNTADIKKIEKRLTNLEKSNKSYGRYNVEEASSSSKTGTVAKISLGLSLIISLFVAR